MERIMLVINAVNMNKDSLYFACEIARLTNSELTGLFLENLPEDERLVIRSAYDGTYINLEVDRDAPEFIAKQHKIGQNIAAFKDGCLAGGVRSSVCRDEGRPLHETLRESRFADLLIVEAGLTFKKRFTSMPSVFVSRLLRSVSCPVIVIPPGVREISHIIFAYDGTSSAMFAIRQFSYLFPELSSYKLVIVNASDREDARIMLPAQLKEWLEAHYTSFVFEELHGKRLEMLLDYLAARKNAIVVMGSYGRSRISRLIRESSTGILIRQLSLPFFVAHL